MESVSVANVILVLVLLCVSSTFVPVDGGKKVLIKIQVPHIVRHHTHTIYVHKPEKHKHKSKPKPKPHPKPKYEEFPKYNHEAEYNHHYGGPKGFNQYYNYGHHYNRYTSTNSDNLAGSKPFTISGKYSYGYSTPTNNPYVKNANYQVRKPAKLKKYIPPPKAEYNNPNSEVEDLNAPSLYEINDQNKLKQLNSYPLLKEEIIYGKPKDYDNDFSLISDFGYPKVKTESYRYATSSPPIYELDDNNRLKETNKSIKHEYTKIETVGDIHSDVENFPDYGGKYEVQEEEEHPLDFYSNDYSYDYEPKRSNLYEEYTKPGFSDEDIPKTAYGNYSENHRNVNTKTEYMIKEDAQDTIYNPEVEHLINYAGA